MRMMMCRRLSRGLHIVLLIKILSFSKRPLFQLNNPGIVSIPLWYGFGMKHRAGNVKDFDLRTCEVVALGPVMKHLYLSKIL